MIEVDVRDCAFGDLAVLERWRPFGVNRRHEIRYQRQVDGVGTYLIAWSENAPVGSGEILWTGCQAESGCPEISALEVWPESLRSQGIGTQLIATAEQRVRDRGFERVGLGVDDSNPGAARLYERLGYKDTGVRYLARYQWIDAEGIRHDEADPCRWLTKRSKID